ncbi:BamA/TamA family outer membrane protein [Cyanobium sp. WAJ14-Wanaka]|uniref:BamA/TamA family outer membrane protein n=1 Tax=Cyanobium sp. WAJ14-Wanaka TaxID=2823725 RepID=UPI0020CDC3B8|nr:BamA/TamA family outer membrane protein [Cyanobium sp. WAJ14-Wanaka]MCP9775167.1 BamA/TamA family outer membrane protein [Cyanobium sp. WAJ14-Wanaka]
MAGSLGFRASALPAIGAALPAIGAMILASAPALAQAPPGNKPAPKNQPAKKNLPAAAAKTPPAEKQVLISEVAIEGLQGHPERERLELAAYAAMVTTPGTRVTRSQLQNDLSAIYASGWFSDVQIKPIDGPLGVRLVVTLVANPVLTKVSLDLAKPKLPPQVIKETFAADYGKTLNLNTLQQRMQELQKWYADQGYSLARVTGPGRVSPDGDVQLQVREGTVAGVDVEFINKEGSTTNDKGQTIKGKTKLYVITREVSLKAGALFNRRTLEEDIKRLYGTGLFGDVKVTLKPLPSEPGKVTVVLGIVEQSSGSLSGGLGYSQSQGVFGQIQLQDSNLWGKAWDLSTNISYGQYGGLGDISLSNPWIKGNKYRTSMRTRIFFSREVPQIFQSENNSYFATLNGDSPPTNTGNEVAVQRIGASVQFVRPLNGGNPFKKAPWNLILAFGGQKVTPMDYSGTAAARASIAGQPNSNICLAYNCATENQLLSFRLGTAYSTLNDPRNPTKGNFFTASTEQFMSVGPDSPTFNRLRASATHYIPVNWIKIFKGCRPKNGETPDCKQALAFQGTLGTMVGDVPPYEAFCLGGGNSVRGYYTCDLGVGKSMAEATIEYRFPLFKIISGELFVDAGTTFGSQADISGNPGGKLGKPGDGFSVGTGLIVNTPVGPLRLEIATQDFTSNYRFNLGVGWKF